MTKSEKAKIIMKEVDGAYSIPSYLEDRVREAIVKALVVIEKKEGKDD